MLITVSAGSGQQITSTFDTDVEGWTASIGTPEHRTGGNPGGYLYIDNPETQIVELSAPPKFLGNLIGYNRGELSWDGNMLEALDPPYDAEELNYGTVTIFGAGQRVTADLVMGPPPANKWTTFRVPLESTTFRVDPVQWSAILNNVTGILINVEAIFGREKQGVDNVVLRALIQQNLIVEPRTLTFKVDTARPTHIAWNSLSVRTTSGTALVGMRETGGQYLEPFSGDSFVPPGGRWVRLKPGLAEGTYQTTILVESIGYDPVEVPVTIRVENEQTRAAAVLNLLPNVTSRLRSPFDESLLCALLELDAPSIPDGVVIDKISPRPNTACPQSYRISITNPPGGNILYDKIQLGPAGGAPSDTLNVIRPPKGGLSVTWGDLNFTAASNGAPSQSREIIIQNNGAEPIRVQTSIEQGRILFSGLSQDYVLQPGETLRDVLGFTPSEAPVTGTYQGMIRIKGSDGSSFSGQATAEIGGGQTLDLERFRRSFSNNATIIRGGGGLTAATVSNPLNNPIRFQARVLPGENAALTVEPQQGTIPPGQSQNFTITPSSGVQSEGRGAVQIRNADDLSQEAAIFHRLLHPGKSPQGNQLGKRLVNQGACQPDKLLPVITVPYVNAALPAGRPVSVRALLLDECGAAVSDGQVTVTPDNGDAAFLLAAAGNGEYAAHWTPLRSSEAGVSLEVISFSADGNLVGALALPVQVVANADAPPMIEELSTVNAATQASGTPHSPGELISIYGVNLASATQQAQVLPLPTELGGARVLLGGNPIPLLYASSGQINAMIPVDAPSGVPLALEVWRGTSAAAPVPLYIAPAVPGVFTQNQSGQGQGIIVDANYQLRDAANPARAGDALVIFLTGLGATDPPIAAGQAGPGPPFSTTVLPVSVSVGGVNAVVVFAGLAPGFAGLYQVNAVMPSGVVAGNDVPVIVKAGDYPGPAVTIATR